MKEGKPYSIGKIKVKNINDDEIFIDSLHPSSTSSINSVKSVNSVSSVKTNDSNTNSEIGTLSTLSTYSVYIPLSISSSISSYIKSISTISTISSTDNVYSEEYEETIVRTKIIGEQDENLIDFNIDFPRPNKDKKKKKSKRIKTPEPSPIHKKIETKKEMKERIKSMLLQYNNDIGIEDFDDVVKQIKEEIKFKS